MFIYILNIYAMKLGTPKQRPTSPHLGIYKPMITSMSSILGRFAGIYIYCLFITIVLLISFKIQNNKDVGSILSIIFAIQEQGMLAKLALFLFSFGSIFAFFLYILALIRHLIWDFGYLLDLKISKIMGFGMFIIPFLISAGLNYYLFF